MLFDDCVSVGALHIAWDRVRRNGGGHGPDGQTIQDIEPKISSTIRDLNNALKTGVYLPGGVRQVQIPKKRGGTRGLSIPNVVDRIIQTSVAQVLQDVLDPEMEAQSFGYRKGKSVQDAIYRISLNRRDGYNWVVDGDIEQYFDNVPHDLLLKRLKESISDRKLIDLISLWLEAYGAEGVGLPQGSPISPVLSNLYLDRVDEEIHGKLIRLVRFADDFVLMCKEPEHAADALDKMDALLAKWGLRLNKDKTRIVPFKKGFRFLGKLFVRSLVLEEYWDDAEGEVPENTNAIAKSILQDVENIQNSASQQTLPQHRPLYLATPGLRLTKDHKSFRVCDDERPIFAVPAHNIGRIELMPDTSADDDALRLALSENVPIHFVTSSGMTQGALLSTQAKKAGLHIEQARHYLDASLRLDLARIFVQGRLHNQRAFLRRLNRKRKEPEIVAACEGINRTIRKLNAAKDVQTLMGFEGSAAALY
jgi:group II intron reverse transcriptase/maturase